MASLHCIDGGMKAETVRLRSRQGAAVHYQHQQHLYHLKCCLLLLLLLLLSAAFLPPTIRGIICMPQQPPAAGHWRICLSRCHVGCWGYLHCTRMKLVDIFYSPPCNHSSESGDGDMNGCMDGGWMYGYVLSNPSWGASSQGPAGGQVCDGCGAAACKLCHLLVKTFKW